MPDLRVLAFTVAILCAVPRTQDVISVNFQGDGGRAVTGLAGAEQRRGWNNVDGGWRGAPIPILTDLGGDPGTRLSFLSASGGQHFQPPGTSEDAALFDGQIVAADGDAVVTVNGVPYRRYDVFVYVGHGPGDAGRDICVSLDGRSVLGANEDISAYADPVQFRLVPDGAPTVAVGNTAVVRGCMSPGFTLTLGPAPGSLIPGRSGIAGFQIVDVSEDTDFDGLEDGWEQHWFASLLALPTEDPDGDGLTNLEEQAHHCNPVVADTDGDGDRDGAEVARSTDPRNRDTDGDGLSDGVETGTGVFMSASDTGSNPLLADSDQDHAFDGAEVRRGTNPNQFASKPRMPNVIVILVDDLGWGELGAYGNTLIRTPEIDRLAAEGVRFTQFYANPVCAPSRCTLLTGQHTGHGQIRTNVKPPLRAGTRTVAHLLGEQGYATACVGKWGFGEVMTTGHPREQGFGEFFGFLDQFHAHWYYPSFLWRNDDQVLYPANNGVWGPTNAGQDHAHDELTTAALDFVDRNRNNPFFLLLTWTIPHVSLQEPPHSDPTRRALGETAIDEFYSDVTWAEPNANFPSTYYTSHARPRRAYASMISALDRDLGRLRTRLEQHGIDRDTMILFTSDNGGTACCGVDAAFFASHGGLRGSKGDVYEGGMRSPCIAWWPGQIPPGRVSDHVGAMWDVLPTLGELVEADVPDDCDGVSFLPTLLGNGESQGRHEYLYWEYEQSGLKKAVRWGDWKGVRHGVAGQAPLQLYDLASDPAEATDVAASWPQVVAQIDRFMGASHLPSPYFRGDDEFPLRRNMHIGQGQDGVALASHVGTTGTVLAPFAHDLTLPVAVTFSCKVIDLGNRPIVALLLGDGEDPTPHVRFGIDVRQRELFVVHGSTRLVAALPANDSPLRLFTLRARLDPTTGDVSLSEGERTWITGVLPNAPSQITHYGHELVNAVAVVGPIDPPADRMMPRGRYSVFGAGCLGTAGRPTLWPLSEPPALGHAFTVLVAGLPPQQGVPVTGLLGSSATMWGTVPLPLALDALGLTGCQLFVTPDVLVPLANGGGTARWLTAIPASISLLGGAFHQQALVLDLAANPGGFTLTNGGSATIGVR